MSISSRAFSLPWWRALLSGWIVISASMIPQAQPAGPRVGYVYPAGGRQGSMFEVTVGGQRLNGATNVFINGQGVQATFVEYRRPLTQKEFNDLRDQVKELQDRKAASSRDASKTNAPAVTATSTNVWTTADEKLLAELREKMRKDPPLRQGNPSLAERATLRVKVLVDAKPGDRELRIGAPTGLSNPLLFQIGQLAEFHSPPAEPMSSVRERVAARRGNAPVSSTERSELRVTLPAVVNGQIMPGEIDRIRFSARKGQSLVASLSARELIPYLPDAVPGWFQATLALYDSKGNELRYADDFRFQPDPVLYCEIPADGDYTCEIKDSIYRGREDFVYRLTLGGVPFLTSVFPLGGPEGKPTLVKLAGWNLPTNQLVLEPAVAGIVDVAVQLKEWSSNRLPFLAEPQPDVLEQEKNDQPVTAQALTLPTLVNGRIDRPGDRDVFQFEGTAGNEVVAEITARRLGSPLDSVVRLTDAEGRELAFNDDHEDKGAGLTTHHADSWLRATLPSNGVYCLQVADTQKKGGPEYAYRLRIGPPQPDFALRVVPSSLTGRGGTAIPVTVYALRKDGFRGEIRLGVKDAPPGFTLDGGRIPPEHDQVRLTFTLPAVAAEAPFAVELEGQATIDGREVVRRVVPAEDMMQAFAYRHLVPAKELLVATMGGAPVKAAVKLLEGTPVRIKAGGTTQVRIGTRGRGWGDRVQLALSEPPSGIEVESVSPTKEGFELALKCDAEKTKVGTQGNLIVNAFAASASTGTGGRASQRRTPLGTLPAIPFEVIAP